MLLTAAQRRAMLTTLGAGSVTITDGTLNGRAVVGLFGKPYTPVNFDAGTAGAVSQQPVLTVVSEDIADLVIEGESVTVGTTTYYVRAAMDDGEGHILLQLQEGDY